MTVLPITMVDVMKAATLMNVRVIAVVAVVVKRKR
jgi:hypothetical protein